MNKTELLLQRLNDIGQSLKDSRQALALLALGSCGVERDRLDQYSDLDFFVIVKDGYKQAYIQDLTWLSNLEPIAFHYQNTVDGHKVLFEDDVFCEFAIFEAHELVNIPFAEGKIIWKEVGFDGTICQPQRLPSKENRDREWLLGEILCNLYIGLGRYQRGEKLAAYDFIQNRSVKLWTELINLEKTSKSNFIDIFNSNRRFEKGYPNEAKQLPHFLQGYERISESAQALLEYLDKHYPLNAFIKEKIRNLL